MGKITIKHYVNTKLKPDHEGLYPIYILLTINRQNTKFRSQIEFRLRSNSDLVKIKKELEDETNNLLGIANRIKTDGKQVTIKDFATDWRKSYLDYEKVKKYFFNTFGLGLTNSDVSDIIAEIKKARIFK